MAVWRVKGHFWSNIFVWNNFQMAKFLSHFQSRIRRCLLYSKDLWGYEHWKGVYQNMEKTSESSFLETAFSRAKCRLSGNKLFFLRNKFTNKNCTSLVYFDERNALQSISTVIFKKLFLFDTLSWFASVDWRVFQYSKIGHARRLGYFTREITLKNEYLSQFLPDRKVLWITLEQLFEIFIKLPMFDSSRAICVWLRG